MAVHWTSEMIKWEYRDLQATAMSVDYTGNNVLLAGRRWLAIKQISLDDEPGDIIRKYPRHSKYDATGAEWCQTYHGQKLCAIASNQRVDVYEWRSGSDLSCIASLRGHTRVVSDTHFHRQDHNIIATCSIDTYTHLWDLRDPRKPSVSLCAVAGASQIQWNKVSPHILATAHDGDLKIWDYRKPNAPTNYISAHLCKIHGVDWSPHHSYQLVTSSHDGSIKFFDVNNARRPESTIMTNFPVFRAIYTPFGSGLLTVGVGWCALPRMDQAGIIGIWVAGTLYHRLVGHTDTVQSMVWRPNTSPANYQLVTWGRDQTLRIWPMHNALLKMCNHYLPDDEQEDETASDAISYMSTSSSNNDQSIDSQEKRKSPTSIDEEFDSIREMANIEVTDMDIETRTCQIKSQRNGYIANLQVTFPKNIFEQTIPKFSWLSGTNIGSSATIKVLQAINRTAHRKKKEGQRCLLYCLKTLATSIDEIPVKPSDCGSTKSDRRTQSECENAGDACVPFPRTCSAKWCSVDTLVVFTRPANARRLSLKHESGTPRSMSSLSVGSAAFASGSPLATATTPSPTNSSGFSQMHLRHASNSITTFYFQDRWKSHGRRTGSIRNRNSVSGGSPRVMVFDASPLFPFKRIFAEKYIIRPHNPVEMCEHNEKVALEEGDCELAKAWTLAGLAAKALMCKPVEHMYSSEESLGWAKHALCSEFVQTLISHYAKMADIQMAAMLVCTFKVFNANSDASDSIITTSSANETSTYSTINQCSEVSADDWVPLQSSSCSEAENFYSDLSTVKSDANSCVLDDETVHLYHCFKRVYADVLHRWQYFCVRAEVMKQVSSGSARDASCEWRLEGVALCGVCVRPVRGRAVLCAICRHLLHASHADYWFSKYDTCPVGCGCKCVMESNSLWKSVKFV